jgi:hypothetical protein
MELGMLFGLMIGGGVGIILYATTGNPVYLAIAGIGLALGIGLGAALDASRRPDRERGQRLDGDDS